MLCEPTCLEELKGNYAFYYRRADQTPLARGNCERFHSASLIKIPILLAWVWLERRGEVSRVEICSLDSEEPVQGAGLAWLFHTRQLEFHDVLLMMIALSDNLCTNLVIRRVGMQRLNEIFCGPLQLSGTQLQRRLMDFEARQRGLDNWISAGDCVRLFGLVRGLDATEKAWVEPMLLANPDDYLFKRDLPPDTLQFYHKTGALPGLLHEWGYTRQCELFLLVENTPDEAATARVFGELGRALLI